MELVKSITLLQRILASHLRQPMTYMNLNADDFEEVSAEASKTNIIDYSDEYELRLKKLDIVFYMED